MKEVEFGTRSKLSNVIELKYDFGYTTKAGVYLAISETLGQTLYQQWKDMPKNGDLTEEELFLEFKTAIRKEIIDFWREKIDQISTKKQLARKFNIKLAHVARLMARLPKAMREHHQMLLGICYKGCQLRFRGLILQVRSEMSEYRRTGGQFSLTRNTVLLVKYRLYWVGLYRYFDKGLCQVLQIEHTAALRLQYGETFQPEYRLRSNSKG